MHGHLRLRKRQGYTEQIDALINRQLKVAPPPRAANAEFVRRIYLDLNVVIPTAHLARAKIQEVAVGMIADFEEVASPFTAALQHFEVLKEDLDWGARELGDLRLCVVRGLLGVQQRHEGGRPLKPMDRAGSCLSANLAFVKEHADDASLHFDDFAIDPIRIYFQPFDELCSRRERQG